MLNQSRLLQSLSPKGSRACRDQIGLGTASVAGALRESFLEASVWESFSGSLWTQRVQKDPEKGDKISNPGSRNAGAPRIHRFGVLGWSFRSQILEPRVSGLRFEAFKIQRVWKGSRKGNRSCLFLNLLRSKDRKWVLRSQKRVSDLRILEPKVSGSEVWEPFSDLGILFPQKIEKRLSLCK